MESPRTWRSICRTTAPLEYILAELNRALTLDVSAMPIAPVAKVAWLIWVFI